MYFSAALLIHPIPSPPSPTVSTSLFSMSVSLLLPFKFFYLINWTQDYTISSCSLENKLIILYYIWCKYFASVKHTAFNFVHVSFKKLLYLFMYCCAGSSLLPAGFLSFQGEGLLLQWLLLLQSTGSRVLRLQELWHMGSVVVVQELNCSSTCGIFPGQGLNQCPLHCKADS